MARRKDIRNKVSKRIRTKEAKNSLWTKDYSCITIASALSIIGGEAMNLPISLLVFEETKSTLASAIILICGMLPDIILPILIAPLIDGGRKKRWIVGLDILLAAVYATMALLIHRFAFRFGMYIAFTLLVGTISVFYRLAYSSWFPDLIPEGCEQKGYAVSGSLYPTISILMAPLATFLYEKLSMERIFLLVAGLTLCSVLVEGLIREKRTLQSQEVYSFSQYMADIKEGLRYIRKEKGIRNIYTYMSITSGTGEASVLMTQAFYQTNPLFSVTMLGFLKSAEMIGRMLSSFVWYHKEIPVKKRYAFTKFSYTFYEIMDMILLFLPYPFMLVNRFLVGAIGTGSATIRETAVQSYLEPGIRARVNAFFCVMFALGGIVFHLFAGWLGTVISYRQGAVLMSCIALICMLLLIVLPAKENRPVYEAVKTVEEK